MRFLDSDIVFMEIDNEEDDTVMTNAETMDSEQVSGRSVKDEDDCELG